MTMLRLAGAGRPAGGAVAAAAVAVTFAFAMSAQGEGAGAGPRPAAAAPQGQGAAADPDAIRPFTIDVPDAVLADLEIRLDRTRLPDELPGTGWDYGTNRDYLEEAARLLAGRLRLARTGADAEPLRPVQDDDRRARRPLHPPALAARGRAAADHHARLARLLHGVPQDDRAADRPDRARRRRGRRVPRRRAVHPRLRLLGQAARPRLQPRADGQHPWAS